jgi:hypothetical protein
MTGVDTRSAERNSLFLLADIRIEQEGKSHRVRVRNLSDGGMMAEGNVKVSRGDRLEVELRNIGCVSGSVAWVQDNRFGIAFDEEIDSRKVRRPVQSGETRCWREQPYWVCRTAQAPDPSKLRKI